MARQSVAGSQEFTRLLSDLQSVYPFDAALCKAVGKLFAALSCHCYQVELSRVLIELEITKAGAFLSLSTRKFTKK